MPKAIVFLFEVHQPYRLNRRFREVLQELVATKGKLGYEDLETAFFDRGLNKYVMERVAKRCYLPANRTILELVDAYRYEPRKFKVSYSLSGVFVEQCEKWAPEVLESFKQLADTGQVEFLDQTYYHSLASVFSEEEFIDQVKEHRRLMKDLLGVEPRAVENTEFIYNNRIAWIFERLGYVAVFTEGVERVLGWRSPNYVYRAKGLRIRVLMRNYRLSDDIGFRFAAPWWEEYPLTADKYAAWLSATPGQVINICIDYETFGEHFPAETGIFEFLRWLPGEVLKYRDMCFMTPSEVAEKIEPVGEIDVPEHATISWADLERDLTAWLMNPMQWEAFRALTSLEKPVKALGDKGLLRLWKLLTTSDHFYYMSTKGGGPGDVHSYFSPYGSALEAFVAFMEVVSDLRARVYAAYEADRLKLALVREVPGEKAFTFYAGWGRPLGLTARSVVELVERIKAAPIESIEFHVREGHFANWLEFVIGDPTLAQRVRELRRLRGEELRRKLVEVIEARIREVLGGER